MKMSFNKTPIFSIIIPTYNSGTTLKIALESIVNQSFICWEVLIMDSLSNDDTIKIAEKYKKNFNTIRIYSEKDKGIYDAMNKGIDLAHGDWIYFMGSDDFLYDSNTLERFIKLDEIKNNEVVYGNVYSTRFKGPYDGEFSHTKLRAKNICHQSIFFRKSVFKKIGVFNLKYKVWGDWDHNIRWFFSSKISRIYINQIIANYADGGFSSLNIDENFERDMNFLIMKKGFGKLSDSELMSHCNNAINFTKQERDYFKLIVSYSFKIGLTILLRLKKYSNN